MRINGRVCEPLIRRVAQGQLCFSRVCGWVCLRACVACTSPEASVACSLQELGSWSLSNKPCQSHSLAGAVAPPVGPRSFCLAGPRLPSSLPGSAVCEAAGFSAGPRCGPREALLPGPEVGAVCSGKEKSWTRSDDRKNLSRLAAAAVFPCSRLAETPRQGQQVGSQ